MEEVGFFPKVNNFIRQNPLFIISILLGSVLCTIGILLYSGTNSSDEGVSFITGTPDEVVKPQDITVDIEGQVLKPGVYKLKSGSILQDAITVAGGYTSKADKEYISKNINLAQKVKDSSKVYIPADGEFDSSDTTNNKDIVVEQVLSTNTSVDKTGKIDINTASIEELDTLPNIGPVTAKKIIDNRPYGTIDELIGKKIIGQKTFDGLKDRLQVE